MEDETVVHLFPDGAGPSWRSRDLGLPEVTIRRGALGWEAQFERRTVLSAGTARELAAGLYHEYGLRTVLDGAGEVA